MKKIQVPTLKLILDKDGRSVFEVRKGDIVTIGRDPGCLIQLSHPSVSPVHCRVEYHNDAFVLTDLDSATGVRSKGKRHKNLLLFHNLAFEIGEISVTCREGMTEVASREGHAGPGSFLPQKVHTRGAALAIRTREEVALFFKDSFRILRRTPAFTISLVLHALIFAIVYDLPYIRKAIFTPNKIAVEFYRPSDVLALEEKEIVRELTFDDPPLLPDEVSELWEESFVEPREEREAPIEPLTINVSEIGLGGTPFPVPVGPSGPGLLSRGLSDGFVNFIADLDKRGMDVVFVIDSTSSMERFILEAKDTINRLIGKLWTLVPSIRIGIVAYRDNGDEFVKRIVVDLTGDRYEVLNSLKSLQAEGGGDRDEAIYEGLNCAINHLFWRPQSQRVVLLVGDSGFHRGDERALDRLLVEFKKKRGVVHTIFVGPEDPMGTPLQRVLEMYDHIARVTEGTCVQLLGFDEATFINLAFTNRFEPDVAGLIDKLRSSKGSKIIERKINSHDREWLIDNLTKEPVHNRIVEAVLTNISRHELERLVGYLESPVVPKTSKSAALYIIASATGRELRFDPNQPVMAQEAELSYIRQLVGRYPFSQPPHRPDPMRTQGRHTTVK